MTTHVWPQPGPRKMHLLFDLDGTLTDPFTGITRCIQHALEALGRPVPPADQLGWCIGPPLKESLATLLGAAHAHLAGEALAKYRERFGEVGLFENEVYPDVRVVLAELRSRGHRLCVATSKPAVFARRIVDHFGLTEFFSTVEGSELDGTLVDKTSLIGHVLRLEGIAPVDALMIGDRKHDVVGSRANGVLGVGVLWGYGSREELEAAGAFACVAAPRDLIDVVETVECARALLSDLAFTLDGDHSAWVHGTAAALRTYLDGEWMRTRLVEGVQQQIHDEHICSTWPTCPRHGTHPLWLHDGRWVCERDDVVVAEVGKLHTVLRR